MDILGAVRPTGYAIAHRLARWRIQNKADRLDSSYCTIIVLSTSVLLTSHSAVLAIDHTPVLYWDVSRFGSITQLIK